MNNLISIIENIPMQYDNLFNKSLKKIRKNEQTVEILEYLKKILIY